jgi:glycosyltransferase involved in cell wall biosynthesis
MDNLGFDDYERNMVDKYGRIPVLKLDDLSKRDDNLPIKMSMIIGFTNWRREQLARSLETICKQNFKDFEVIISENGSTQDMDSIYNIFEPYLRLKIIKTPRNHWSSDVTKAIRIALPYAKGDVISIMQPEMMLNPMCFDYLYWCHYKDMPNTIKYVCEKPNALITDTDEKYVTIRNYFLSNKITQNLDSMDWHSNIRNIEHHPEFWTHGEGLSNWSNSKHWEHQPHQKWIWWFISSAKKSATIWEDMPDLDGHAGIDFYLIWYRKLMNYIDVCPQIGLAYHQEHIRASISPDRDNWIQSPAKMQEYLMNKNRNIINKEY